MFAQHSNVWLSALPFPSYNFNNIISVTACTHSHKPFWKGLSAAVVITLTFKTDITSRISSELNSAPLSVIIEPIIPKTAIHLCIKAFSTLLDFFLSMKTETVYRDHMSIMWKIQRWFHCFKSIVTFLLKWDAIGKLTTGRGWVLAYHWHNSQFLPICTSRSV